VVGGETGGVGKVTALAADGLTKTFGDERAVDDVEFTVDDGEFFALIGPSGCGKTTTLRLLAGLSTPDAGVVRVGGEDITDQPARDRPTNMVFQDLVLFPHMTVAENVAYGLKQAGMPAADRTSRVEDTLALVEMSQFADRDPTELSGGQQQRVALARALATEPDVLLLDEPLSSLDRALRAEMEAEFRRIQRDAATSFLYVTHDQTSAMSMADRIAVMRDGQIRDIGAPDRLYERPQTRFVADFLGDATVLSGTVTEVDSTVTVDTPAGTVRADPNGQAASVDETVSVMIRPESVTVGTGSITGTVIDHAYKGFFEEATVELSSGGQLTVRRGEDSTAAVRADGSAAVGSDPGAFAVGDSVRLQITEAVLVEA
jgi:spermidine/putrescine transport system ATP-binding protein